MIENAQITQGVYNANIVLGVKRSDDEKHPPLVIRWCILYCKCELMPGMFLIHFR